MQQLLKVSRLEVVQWLVEQDQSLLLKSNEPTA